MEIGSARPIRNSKQRADLGVLVSLDVMQQQYRSLTFPQLGDRRRQPSSQLVPLRGIEDRIGERDRKLFHGANLSATREVERRVRGNPAHPGTEGLTSNEAIQRAVRVQKSFLNGVFRVFMRTDNGARDRVRPALMQQHQLAECLGGTSLRRLNEDALGSVDPFRVAGLHWGNKGWRRQPGCNYRRHVGCDPPTS